MPLLLSAARLGRWFAPLAVLLRTDSCLRCPVRRWRRISYLFLQHTHQCPRVSCFASRAPSPRSSLVYRCTAAAAAACCCGSGSVGDACPSPLFSCPWAAATGLSAAPPPVSHARSVASRAPPGRRDRFHGASPLLSAALARTACPLTMRWRQAGGTPRCPPPLPLCRCMTCAGALRAAVRACACLSGCARQTVRGVLPRHGGEPPLWRALGASPCMTACSAAARHEPQPPLSLCGHPAHPHRLLRELWALLYVSPCALCTRWD